MFTDDGSERVWGLGKGSNFQFVRGPQNWILGHFQAEGAVWPNFLKICVDFEVAHFIHTHGSDIAIPWDSYLKHSVAKVGFPISKSVSEYSTLISRVYWTVLFYHPCICCSAIPAYTSRYLFQCCLLLPSPHAGCTRKLREKYWWLNKLSDIEHEYYVVSVRCMCHYKIL